MIASETTSGTRPNQLLAAAAELRQQAEQSLLTVGAHFAVKEAETDPEGAYHWTIPTDPHVLMGTRAGMSLRDATMAYKCNHFLQHHSIPRH